MTLRPRRGGRSRIHRARAHPGRGEHQRIRLHQPGGDYSIIELHAATAGPATLRAEEQAQFLC